MKYTLIAAFFLVSGAAFSADRPSTDPKDMPGPHRLSSPASGVAGGAQQGLAEVLQALSERYQRADSEALNFRAQMRTLEKQLSAITIERDELVKERDELKKQAGGAPVTEQK